MNFLIDTDILIDYLRNDTNAIKFLEMHTSPPFLSTVTVAELYAGVKDGKERKILDQFIHYFTIIPVDLEISRLGGLYRRDFGPKQGTGLADAIIAATATQKNIRLATLNKKHFPMLNNIYIPYSKPLHQHLA